MPLTLKSSAESEILPKALWKKNTRNYHQFKTESVFVVCKIKAILFVLSPFKSTIKRYESLIPCFIFLYFLLCFFFLLIKLFDQMTLQERNNTDDNTMNCSQYFCDSKLNDDESCPFSCYIICPKICKTFSYDDDVESPPPPPPRSITTNLVIMAGVLAGAFLLGVCWILVLNFYSKWKSSRRVNSPILDDAHEDFHDGNHGPEVEHHIWYINTVGLQQSVIDSITVCKFKKDEGLIEGVECSVCLSEFQEDETLRLLPKCSHAFHLPCIDTWLRSHKNCPMCRAAIVNEYVSSVFNATGANLDDLDSREDTQVENMENHGGMGIHEVGDSGTNEVRSRTEDFDATPIQIGRISEILNKSTPYFEARNCEVRVQSDLAKNRGVPEQEIQPMKRSVSLDSSSASVIHRAMANVAKHEGSSHSQLVRVKNPNSGIVAKLDGSGSSSIYKLMKSSSTGRSLQKKPISMKRSFSSSGKLSVHKQSRSQTSILPF